MKRVMLESDILKFLHEEFAAVQKKIPEENLVRDLSFMTGYKQGQLAALQRVYNFVYGIDTRPRKPLFKS